MPEDIMNELGMDVTPVEDSTPEPETEPIEETQDTEPEEDHEPADTEGEPTSDEPVEESDEPADETPEPAEPADKEEQFRAEIARLHAENARLSQYAPTDSDTSKGDPKDTSAQTKEDTSQTPQDPTNQSAINFIQDEDEFAEVLSSVEAFNAKLNQVYQAGRQSYLRETPAMVQYHQVRDRELQKYSQDFYTVNKDLAQYKEVVYNIANEIVRTKPNSTPESLFKEVAVEARKRLNLPTNPKGSSRPNTRQKAVPGLPGSRNAKTGNQAPKTDVLKELF